MGECLFVISSLNVPVFGVQVLVVQLLQTLSWAGLLPLLLLSVVLQIGLAAVLRC